MDRMTACCLVSKRNGEWRTIDRWKQWFLPEKGHGCRGRMIDRWLAGWIEECV